ncbi:MAG: cbb3-type cytochrome oxidase assembly protein CcoS [Pseudomonadota bacterium]
MTGLAFLIPIALGMGALGLLAFFWTVKSGQYEDLEGSANRILIDEEEEQG